jgi:hypothetical protein
MRRTDPSLAQLEVVSTHGPPGVTAWRRTRWSWVRRHAPERGRPGSAREDFAKLGGEFFGFTGHAVLVAQEAAVVAGEHDGLET